MFKNAFVGAMHPTLVVPIAIVLLAALSCLAVGQGKSKAQRELTGRGEPHKGEISGRWAVDDTRLRKETSA